MERTKVKILQSMRGSEDGHTLQMFEKGKTYDMEFHLAVTFVNEGWAELVEKTVKKPVKKAAKKAAKGAPENKMLDGAPDDKADPVEVEDEDYTVIEPGEDAGEEGGEVEDEAADFPPLSYAKHSSFGRWFIHTQDGAKISGPHSKQEVIDLGFET